MIKTNKLPQKKTLTLNHYVPMTGKNGIPDSDTTSNTSLPTITSTHIFIK